MLGSLMLSTLVLYVPFLSDAFGFTHISLAEYGVALLLAFTVIPVVELIKAVQRAFSRRREGKKKS